MAGERLIGVDIGTQGTKAALFDRSGACLAEAYEKSELLHPEPGIIEEDPERQVASVLRTIRKCVEVTGSAPGSVAAVGLDGQMAGILGIGADGRNVTPYDSWLDTRCAPYIQIMEREAGEEITRKCGGPPSFNHGPRILWWMHERPEVYRRIRCFVQPGTYAVMRLCGLSGREAFIDQTYLHFSGFADNARLRWDAELCRHFAVDPEVLPRILDSRQVVGGLTAEAGEACGLDAGTPVVAGCGDTAASFLSCGATSEGISVDVAGTASAFATTIVSMKPDVENRVLACSRSVVPGLWHPHAYINGGGMNLEWFRNDIARASGFAELDRQAEGLEPSEDDPLFVPHLGGRVCPSQPALRGAWLGLSWNHSRGHLYRAVLEGVALEYAVYLDILRKLDPQFRSSEVRVTGGGGRNTLWNQIKADILGIPVRVLSRGEGAPLGAALLAGFGAGLFSSLDQAAAAWISAGETVQPDPTHRKLAGPRLERYQEALQALNGWAAR